MRLEFSRATRREALKRAGGRCEASGVRYGVPKHERYGDLRCFAPLAQGVEFDHFLPAEFGGDNSLENCRAICKRCHKYATANDIRAIRKSDRQRDKNSGAYPRSKRPIGNPRFKQKIGGGVVYRATGEPVGRRP